jgi:hypothetical protein
MHPDDLAEIKRLAGIPITEAGAGMYTGHNTVPQAAENGITSPVGSNISYTAATRNELMDKYKPRPGSDLWFIINFTLPYLTGSVEDKIEEYFKQHPEQRPENRPRLPGQ